MKFFCVFADYSHAREDAAAGMPCRGATVGYRRKASSGSEIRSPFHNVFHTHIDYTAHRRGCGLKQHPLFFCADRGLRPTTQQRRIRSVGAHVKERGRRRNGPSLERLNCFVKEKLKMFELHSKFTFDGAQKFALNFRRGRLRAARPS